MLKTGSMYRSVCRAAIKGPSQQIFPGQFPHLSNHNKLLSDQNDIMSGHFYLHPPIYSIKLPLTRLLEDFGQSLKRGLSFRQYCSYYSSPRT